jgi:hypothetical protein
MNSNFHTFNQAGESISFKSSATTFNPTVTKLAGHGSPMWLLNNNKRTYANAPNYAGTGTYDVVLSCDRLQNLSTISMFNQRVIGSLDLSKCTNLGTTLSVYTNPQLSAITLPNTSKVFSTVYFSSCGFRELNLTGLTGFGGNFRADTNAGLTGVTFPTSSQTFDQFYLDSCDLRNLDLSGLSNFGGRFRATSNANLTGITFPTSSQTFDQFYLDSCDLRNLDLSGLSNFGGRFRATSNANLTGITFLLQAKHLLIFGYLIVDLKI